MSELPKTTNDGFLDLDTIVERFEDAWQQDGEVRVEDYWPPDDHPQFDQIVLELLCIDLERRARLGRPKSVEAYRQCYPELLDRESILEGLAFEEYRIQTMQGSQVDPTQFGRRYGIRTQHWPKRLAGGDAAAAMAHSALTNGVANEMDRIAHVPPWPQTGEQFLNFDLVEELGKCQFGHVFLAKQTELSDRQVVIKVTSNLWRESDRLARLQHTNIVPVYSVHEQDGLQAVCMPFLGVQTLASIFSIYHQQAEPRQSVLAIWSREQPADQHDQARLRHHVELSQYTHEQICVWIIAQVVAGLSHAHDRGILHRDLKPANILMTDDLRPMILDFNLSEDVVAGGRSAVLIGGTLPYMAPEHLMAVVSEGEVDERSDLYSVGVMLFQLLTGRLPFNAPPSSTIGTLSYLLTERTEHPPAVRAYDAQLSTDVESIVLRCMASHPSDRYQTAHELHEDLQRHLNFLPPKYAPVRSRKEQALKWVKRHPRLTSSSAVIVVSSILIAILAGLYVLRSHEWVRLSAEQRFQEFQALERTASAPLSIPNANETTLALGLSQATSALQTLDADQENWTEQYLYRRLPEAKRTELRALVTRLHYLIANAYLRQADLSPPDDRNQLLQQALHHHRVAFASMDTPGHRAQQLQHDAIQSALGHPANSLVTLPEPEQANDARDPSAAMLLAMHYLRTKQYEQAENILQRLHREHPHDFFAWIMLGNCHAGLQRRAQADACFTAAITLWPESPAAFFLRGMCRMELKRYPEAEADFTRTIALNPDYASALINRGIVRTALKKYEAAILDFSRAIHADRDASMLYLLRAYAYSCLGNEEQAELDYETGKQKVPTCVDGWVHRGLAYSSSDPEQALHDFEAALAIDANARQALHNKVAILAKLERNEEAIEAVSKLIQQTPKDATALLARGLLRARMGDREGALADCDLALQHNSAPNHHYKAARIYANLSKLSPDDLQHAAFHLRKALQTEPSLVSDVPRDPDLQQILHHPEIQRLVTVVRDLLHEE